MVPRLPSTRATSACEREPSLNSPTSAMSATWLKVGRGLGEPVEELVAAEVVPPVVDHVEVLVEPEQHRVGVAAHVDVAGDRQVEGVGG